MLALAHSSSNVDTALLLAIIAAVAIVMFWRPLLKIAIIALAILVLITVASGFSVLVHSLQSLLH